MTTRVPGPDKKTLLWMYETMVTIRRFEEQAKREADMGKLRGMHSSIGQEAVPTGICAHLEEDDYVLGTHRSHHHCIAKGVDLASVWKLPVVFVCENNRYAEATPFEYSVAGGSIANRAAGYGIPGVTVDGQSVLDMYDVGGEAVRRARSGQGPTLVEAQTYRYQGHFGADNPLLYRTEEEQEHYRARDCVDTFTAPLLDAGAATEGELAALDQRAMDSVARASRFADESPFPSLDEITTDVYISYP